MSRILRRPMFRGGRVDSRGTGIASGLSYNNGGRVGFSNGGKINGLKILMASNCGISADLSGAINDRAIYHIDNAYYIPNLELTSHRCKTNTVSNTAFRGFGGPQGMFCIENIIDHISHYLKKNPQI